MFSTGRPPLECRRLIRDVKINSTFPVTPPPSQGVQGEESMKDIKDNLTIKEVAKLLRCSKAHVQNALRGRVPGMPALTHLPMGRRKIVRRQWLEKWMESNKAS